MSEGIVTRLNGTAFEVWCKKHGWYRSSRAVVDCCPNCQENLDDDDDQTLVLGEPGKPIPIKGWED